MKEFEADYIEKLINIMKNNELTEVLLEDNSKSLFIKSNGVYSLIKENKQEQVRKIVKSDEEKTIQPQEKKKNLIPIVSNMIGLYFSKPSPDKPPFVNLGDEIKEGQVVCIIETIKLVNKITSEVSGKIAEICLKDGEPIEYGQVIMYIEQN